VLFKLKPEAGDDKIKEFEEMAKGMVGQIPGQSDLKIKSVLEIAETDLCAGLTQMEVAPPLESTASRGKGFNLGLVASLEKAEDVKTYAEHPVHQKYGSSHVFWTRRYLTRHCRVHKFREEMATDTLAYDLVF